MLSFVIEPLTYPNTKKNISLEEMFLRSNRYISCWNLQLHYIVLPVVETRIVWRHILLTHSDWKIILIFFTGVELTLSWRATLYITTFYIHHWACSTEVTLLLDFGHNRFRIVVKKASSIASWRGHEHMTVQTSS